MHKSDCVAPHHYRRGVLELEADRPGGEDNDPRQPGRIACDRVVHCASNAQVLNPHGHFACLRDQDLPDRVQSDLHWNSPPASQASISRRL